MCAVPDRLADRLTVPPKYSATPASGTRSESKLRSGWRRIQSLKVALLCVLSPPPAASSSSSHFSRGRPPTCTEPECSLERRMWVPAATPQGHVRRSFHTRVHDTTCLLTAACEGMLLHRGIQGSILKTKKQAFGKLVAEHCRLVGPSFPGRSALLGSPWLGRLQCCRDPDTVIAVIGYASAGGSQVSLANLPRSAVTEF